MTCYWVSSIFGPNWDIHISLCSLLQDFPVTGKTVKLTENPAVITGFSWLFLLIPCSALQWRRNKNFLFPNIFKRFYSLALQHTAQWDVNVSIGAKDWWHPTTRHNSDFSSLHVVNTQNSFVYHMEGVTSIIFRNFLSEPLQNFYTLLFMQVYFTMPVFTYKVFFFFGSIFWIQ